MQSYYIQYPSTCPSYGVPQRLNVDSDNLVKSKPKCSQDGEKDVKQDNQYLQPRWCPSGLSHTQKRRLQRMRKESMEQQAEVVLARSVTMKQVWRPKQVVSSSTWKRSKIWPIEFIALRTKYDQCIFVIVLRQFWSRGLFSGMLASPKNRGAYVDDQNWHWSNRPVWPVLESGLTGLYHVAGLATPTGLTGQTVLPGIWVQLELFVDLDL